MLLVWHTMQCVQCWVNMNHISPLCAYITSVCCPLSTSFSWCVNLHHHHLACEGDWILNALPYVIGGKKEANDSLHYPNLFMRRGVYNWKRQKPVFWRGQIVHCTFLVLLNNVHILSETLHHSSGLQQQFMSQDWGEYSNLWRMFPKKTMTDMDTEIM